MKVPFPFSYVLIKSVFMNIIFRWSFVFRILNSFIKFLSSNVNVKTYVVSLG